MKQLINLAVFPCGSEVALEIHRSLENNIHCNLIGLNSVDDHGKFVFKNYIGGLPFIKDPGFIMALKLVIVNNEIDAIYPAMDQVIAILKEHEDYLGCKVIASSLEATKICVSKSKTYQILEGVVPIPILYKETDYIKNFPVFLKPDVGYGSRGVKMVKNKAELNACIRKRPDLLILEFLPGREYTIDCFTDFSGNLLFAGARQRKRIVNGISVNTATMPQEDRFFQLAMSINEKIIFNGAWFFQVKERQDGTLVLMEVASRMAGSSSVYRAKGVNFALLSLFNAFNIPTAIILNNFEVELDRALDNKYSLKNITPFEHVYIDFDDTLIFEKQVNAQLVALIYHFLNQKKKLYLITKHAFDIKESLKNYRLSQLFDEVIHLKKDEEKWKRILHNDAILIDDSFAERKSVNQNLNIPVFGIDQIEILF